MIKHEMSVIEVDDATVSNREDRYLRLHPSLAE